jgi:hypothetical protein
VDVICVGGGVTAFLQLHQRDERGADGLAEYIDICITVLRVGRDGTKTLVGTTGALVDRQGHLQVCSSYSTLLRTCIMPRINIAA